MPPANVVSPRDVDVDGGVGSAGLPHPTSIDALIHSEAISRISATTAHSLSIYSLIRGVRNSEKGCSNGDVCRKSPVATARTSNQRLRLNRTVAIPRNA